MWLIETSTLKLEYFIEVEADVQKYAILSHAWGPEEVTLGEMAALQPGGTLAKLGFDKIARCCERAKADGLKYAWVDTCCIDKTSSAELSESINSMYRWYQEAQVCYAYMADVPAQATTVDASFAASRWFTRGWTLQELIAPRDVQFFSEDWEPIGTKRSLVEQIHGVTKIDKDILLGEKAPQDVSVARRMSWAAGRTTTRTEDMAYCLLGIFDINMPMLYGEGKKAFIRLQEEILRESDDHTIFVWEDADNTPDDKEVSLLASHPRCFKNTGDYIPHYGKKSENDRLKVDISNRGVGVNVWLHTDAQGDRLAYLQCCKNSRADCFAYIYLNSGEVYDARVRSSQIGFGYTRGSMSMINVYRGRAKNQVTKRVYDKTFSIRMGDLDRCKPTALKISQQSALITAAGDPIHTDPDGWLDLTGREDELTQWSFGLPAPGQLAVALQFECIDLEYRYRRVGVMRVLFGVLQDGRLGFDFMSYNHPDFNKLVKSHIPQYHSYFKPDMEFRGIRCPGEVEYKHPIARCTYALTARELERSEAGAADQVINIQLRRE